MDRLTKHGGFTAIKSLTEELGYSHIYDKLAKYEDEAEQREQGCEYCNGDYETQEPLISDISSVATLDIRKNIIAINPTNTISFKEYFIYGIKFCPICGRKLGG